jgi:hypothetical protein
MRYPAVTLAILQLQRPSRLIFKRGNKVRVRGEEWDDGQYYWIRGPAVIGLEGYRRGGGSISEVEVGLRGSRWVFEVAGGSSR